MFITTENGNVYVFWKDKESGRSYYGITNVDTIIINLADHALMVRDVMDNRIIYNAEKTPTPEVGKRLTIYNNDSRFSDTRVTSVVTAVYC